MKTIPRLVFFLAAFASSSFAGIDLFNGKDLTGWVKRGGDAPFVVEDGAIVGTYVTRTTSTFLCTEKEYGDFILEMEFQVPDTVNSGVQFRSQVFPEERAFVWRGEEIKIPANRVHGYQFELDLEAERNRWWVGGIYDEARRKWLYPGKLGGDKAEFSSQGKRLARRGEWMKMRVEARGPLIRTFVDGELRASIIDEMTPRGFIALQVHSIPPGKAEGAKIRFRNIRIEELSEAGPNTLTAEEKAAGWRLLWDGKSTEGWRSHRGPGFPKTGWFIKDGMLQVEESGGEESAHGGDIVTTEKFSNFELSVDFRISEGANSGIKIFVDPELNKGPGSAIGPEFQILDDATHPDAKLGKDGSRTIGSLYDLLAAPADKTVNPPGEWNNARIVSQSNRVTFFLNGKKTVEIERGTPEWRTLVAGSKYEKWPKFGELPTGHILLQDHGDAVAFRNIKIRELPAAQ